MNALSRTIIAIVAAGLVAVASVSAQNLPDENSREALAAQREAEIAQRQAEAAQKQLEVARRQAVVAEAEATLARAAATAPPAVPAPPTSVPTPPAPPAPVSVSTPYITFNSTWPSRAGGAGSVLVIPSAEVKAEDIFTITEDMNVMSRIFEKNLEQARITTARGGLFASRRDPFIALLGADSGAIESMYLQGYGALFFVKVDFPLSGPPLVE